MTVTQMPKIVILITIFLVLLLSSIFMMQSLHSSLQGTTMILGVDLYPRWVGTQAVLHGESPYSQATRQQIWLEIYGSTDMPDGNVFGFYYPPAITTLLMPFVLLGLSGKLAAILWCAFLWAILSIVLLNWSIRFRQLPKGYLILPALLISGWFFRPAFSNYFLGQYALLSVLTAIAAWYCLENERPIWAGIFASLSLVKPSLTVIPIGYLFIKHWRNPKGILALIASSLLLYLPPTILVGWWLPDFLSDISGYALENRVSWSAIGLLTVPGIIWGLASLSLFGLGIKRKDSFLTLGAAFALNAAITPHSADYDLVAFVPLLVYVGNHWILAKNRRGLYLVSFFALVWFPWLSMAAIIQTADTNAIEAWYRFIWLVYPSMILLVSFLAKISEIKNTTTNKLKSHYAS